MATRTYIDRKLFKFFLELQVNNDRDWFNANKQRYIDDVRDPLLQLIRDFEPYLHKISKHLVADARSNGGSMFRIYRDTRFSHDKTPYKTHAGIHFRHSVGKDAHAPGFYLHLDPKEVMVGGGIWHPDGPTLAKIRQAIVAKPKDWQRVVNGKKFKTDYGLWGESLKRAPQGVDPQHPLIDDLKRKDFAAMRTLSVKQACAPDFIKALYSYCKDVAPLNAFLTRAIGVPW